MYAAIVCLLVCMCAMVCLFIGYYCNTCNISRYKYTCFIIVKHHLYYCCLKIYGVKMKFAWVRFECSKEECCKQVCDIREKVLDAKGLAIAKPINFDDDGYLKEDRWYFCQQRNNKQWSRISILYIAGKYIKK